MRLLFITSIYVNMGLKFELHAQCVLCIRLPARQSRIPGLVVFCNHPWANRVISPLISQYLNWAPTDLGGFILPSYLSPSHAVHGGSQRTKHATESLPSPSPEGCVCQAMLRNAFHFLCCSVGSGCVWLFAARELWHARLVPSFVSISCSDSRSIDCWCCPAAILSPPPSPPDNSVPNVRGLFRWSTLRRIIEFWASSSTSMPKEIFRVDFLWSGWFDLVASRTLEVFSAAAVQKRSAICNAMVQLSTSMHDYWKIAAINYMDLCQQSDKVATFCAVQVYYVFCWNEAPF